MLIRADGHVRCIVNVRVHRCMTNLIPLDQRSAAATDTPEKKLPLDPLS
jgi:hypothetical protein